VSNRSPNPSSSFGLLFFKAFFVKNSRIVDRSPWCAYETPQADGLPRENRALEPEMIRLLGLFYNDDVCETPLLNLSFSFYIN
jgi:hypothetical protein